MILIPSRDPPPITFVLFPLLNIRAPEGWGSVCLGACHDNAVLGPAVFEHEPSSGFTGDDLDKEPNRQRSGLALQSGHDAPGAAAALVHVVDDDQAFRTAVGRMLRLCKFDIALYESADQLLEKPLRTDRGCILLDVQMTGVDGLALQGRLAQMGNVLPIIFLTGHGDIPTSVRAIKAGADDFLSKPVTTATLKESVQRALERYDATHRQQVQLNALRALVTTLTPREREVFDLVVRGKLNKQIAYQLGTSERTIKAHRHSVMQKLQIGSVAEAASIAERLGILAPASGA